MVDVQKQLEKGFYIVLHKNEPKFHEVDVLFGAAVISQSGLLVVHASGTIPKESDTADYVLKFKITGEADKVQFQLQSGRKLREYSASNNEDIEAQLNKVYNSVRAKLTQKQRETLRDEQTRWLKLREEINDEDSRDRFTKHRIGELRTLSESQ